MTKSNKPVITIGNATTNLSSKGYDVIDEASAESFPTSDPPAWTLGTNKELADAEKSELKDVTHILYREHLAIKAVIHLLDKLSHQIEHGSHVDPTQLNNLCAFFLNFVSACHHQKEETLFPTLTHGDNHPSNYLLNDLVHEHESGKKLAQDLQRTMKEYSNNNKAWQTQMINILHGLQHLYSNHIAKEDEYILPAINKILTKQEQETLLTKFDAIEKHLEQKSYKQYIEYAETLEKI